MTRARSQLLPPDPNQYVSDFLFPHTRQIVRVDEAAKALAVSDDQIRNLLDEGKIEGVMINAADRPERQHIRILRPSLERFVANRKV